MNCSRKMSIERKKQRSHATSYPKAPGNTSVSTVAGGLLPVSRNMNSGGRFSISKTARRSFTRSVWRVLLAHHQKMSDKRIIE